MVELVPSVKTAKFLYREQNILITTIQKEKLRTNVGNGIPTTNHFLNQFMIILLMVQNPWY